jgi:hypothetical protein
MVLEINFMDSILIESIAWVKEGNKARRKRGVGHAAFTIAPMASANIVEYHAPPHC